MNHLKLFEEFSQNQFTEINNKEELLEELNKRMGEDVVIHYRCSECSDEQVTYETEVNEEIINSIKKDGQIMISLDCTNCDFTERFIDTNSIFGIEKIK